MNKYVLKILAFLSGNFIANKAHTMEKCNGKVARQLAAAFKQRSIQCILHACLFQNGLSPAFDRCPILSPGMINEAFLLHPSIVVRLSKHEVSDKLDFVRH